MSNDLDSEKVKLENEKLKFENQKLQQEKEERERQERLSKISANRTAAFSKLESAVKDEVITPAQREVFSKTLKLDDDESMLKLDMSNVDALINIHKKDPSNSDGDGSGGGDRSRGSGTDSSNSSNSNGGSSKSSFSTSEYLVSDKDYKFSQHKDLGSPSDLLHKKTRKYMVDHGLKDDQYDAALNIVMSENPNIARAFVYNDGAKERERA